MAISSICLRSKMSDTLSCKHCLSENVVKWGSSRAGSYTVAATQHKIIMERQSWPKPEEKPILKVVA